MNMKATNKSTFRWSFVRGLKLSRDFKSGYSRSGKHQGKPDFEKIGIKASYLSQGRFFQRVKAHAAMTLMEGAAGISRLVRVYP
jgi:hypothetical protein